MLPSIASVPRREERHFGATNSSRFEQDNDYLSELIVHRLIDQRRNVRGRYLARSYVYTLVGLSNQIKLLLTPAGL